MGPVNVRDDLILVGWLSGLAPDSALLPGAGPLATAEVVSAYPDAAGLDEGLANCLRRCVATAVLQVIPPERAAEPQRAVMTRKDAFRDLLADERPLLAALSAEIGKVPALQPVAGSMAASVLDLFRLQARELFPREEDGGAARAVRVLEQLRERVDAHGRLAVEAELASLHQRAGDVARASEIRGNEDGFTWLDRADQAAGNGDMEPARAHLARARQLFERAGLVAGLAAVRRREAALMEPSDRVGVLVDAVRLSRRAPGDTRGEVEGLEDLSRAWSESGRLGPAVAALGEIARLQRQAADPVGEARALQLAGRLLCEAPGAEQDAGAGLVMLLWAADIGGSVDPVLADLTHRYVQGFQYTLSDAEWARIEPLFDQNREAVVDATFARYRHDHARELP